MDMYDYDQAHSGGSAEGYQKRQVSYIDNPVNLGYDFSILKKQQAVNIQIEVGGGTPGIEARKQAEFNFGSMEEKMFVP